VRLAPAIRTSEAGHRDGRAGDGPQLRRPGVLAAGSTAVPNRNQSGVVDVPVGMFGSVLVVPDPGAQPSRAERGTNVHVVPGLQWKDPKSPHADAGGDGGCEHEGVGAGSRRRGAGGARHGLQPVCTAAASRRFAAEVRVLRLEEGFDVVLLARSPRARRTVANLLERSTAFTSIFKGVFFMGVLMSNPGTRWVLRGLFLSIRGPQARARRLLHLPGTRCPSPPA
jgi:hypothetical protein